MPTDLKSSDIEHINMDKIRALLNNDQWTPIDREDCSQFIAYRAPVFIGAPHKITLPASLSDAFINTSYFSELIIDTVTKLAHIYDLSPVEMADKIKGYRSGLDTMSLRLFPDTAAANVPIKDFQSVINSLVSLLQYSATSEGSETHQPYYERTNKAGRDITSNFNFAHTFEGSFGIRIKSKFTYQSTLFELPAEEYPRNDIPLQRRTLERVMLGVTKTAEAANSDSPDAFKIISDDFEYGFNANMCNVLSDMLVDNDIPELEWKFNLDTDLPPSRCIRNVIDRGIRIKRNSVPILRDASKTLTPSDREKDIREFRGTVVEVKSRYSNGLDIAKTVKIEGEKKNDPTFSVEMYEEMFREAERAHDSHKKIYIKGELVRDGYRWALNDIIAFNVIDD